MSALMFVRELAPPTYVQRPFDHTLSTALRTPAETAAVVQALPVGGGRLADAAVEHFGVLVLNTKHRLSSYAIIGVGSIDTAVVHPREVFRPAIIGMGASIIAFHNHPSGDPTPSRDDIALTERLEAAGLVLGISVLDHVIVAGDTYYSFRQHGTL